MRRERPAAPKPSERKAILCEFGNIGAAMTFFDAHTELRAVLIAFDNSPHRLGNLVVLFHRARQS